MTAKALIERWRTPVGQALAEEVVAHLVAGRALDGLDVDEQEGRIDLRGLPAPAPRRLQRFEAAGFFVEQLGDLVEFHGIRLEGLDLSGAQLRSFRFFDTTIANCRFDRADCRDWRLWHCDVADSSFVETDLREAVIGTWHDGRRNSWSSVDFSGADFRGATGARQALFEDCTFSHTRLVRFDFDQCSLSRCRFAGELVEVLFDGRDLSKSPAPPPMREVDFSKSTFQDVEFRGFDLEQVTLPVDPDVSLVRRYRCVAERGLTELEGDESVPAEMLRAQLSGALRGPGTLTEAHVFNRRDYASSGGDELADRAQELFRRLEAECLKGEEPPPPPRRRLLGRR